jgi:hypothetical protein
MKVSFQGLVTQIYSPFIFSNWNTVSSAPEYFIIIYCVFYKCILNKTAYFPFASHYLNDTVILQILALSGMVTYLRQMLNESCLTILSLLHDLQSIFHIHQTFCYFWLLVSYYNSFITKSAAELKNENKFGCLLAEFVLMLSRLLFFPPNYVSTLNNNVMKYGSITYFYDHNVFASLR